MNTTPNRGIVKKYIISKADGSPVDPWADYFVLRLDTQISASHRAACVKAILAYADGIESVNPVIAKEIREKYGDK